MAISGERNKDLTPWVTIYMQGELEQITYFQWNQEIVPRAFLQDTGMAFLILDTPSKSMWGFSAGHVPSPAE